MKLGIEFPREWKEKSEKEAISISDILYGYAVEDLISRIAKSSYHEFLWFTSWGALGEEAYKKSKKDRLEFLYVQSEKKLYQTKSMAGQAFSQSVLEEVMTEIISEKDDMDVRWQSAYECFENGGVISLTATYMGMQVPILLKIEAVHLTTEQPKSKELSFMFNPKKSVNVLTYSKEGSLSEALFEIMRKLELISDMKYYDLANEILKTQTISGRHILEDFNVMSKKEPKMVSLKRLEQLKAYKSYAYMKKKWQKYSKNSNAKTDEWEEVMERIISFMEPLWNALCENTVFLDDWMPELGRFLG